LLLKIIKQGYLINGEQQLNISESKIMRDKKNLNKNCLIFCKGNMGSFCYWD